jgi:hypothetical protein
MKKRVAILASIVCLFLCLAGLKVSWAIVWAKGYGDFGSLPKILSKSSVVFRGIVQAVSYGAVPNPKGRDIPYSKVVIEVLKGYKNCDTGTQIELFLPGGKIGNMVNTWSGQATLKTGEDVFIFYNGEMYPVFGVVGGSSGVFRVVSNDGKNIVLTHDWSPLIQIDQNMILFESKARCLPEKSSRQVCEAWEFKTDSFLTSEEEVFTAAAPLTDFEKVLEQTVNTVDGPSGGILKESDFVAAFSDFISD